MNEQYIAISLSLTMRQLFEAKANIEQLNNQKKYLESLSDPKKKKRRIRKTNFIF